MRRRPGAGRLAHAFEGASQVLIFAGEPDRRGTAADARTAIEQAKAAGAGRILYASHMAASPMSPFPPMPDHAATEAMLRDSGVPFTSLRNGFYAASGRADRQVRRRDGGARRPGGWAVLMDRAPGSGGGRCDRAHREAPRRRRTQVPSRPTSHPSVTRALTGAEAIDLGGVAAMASEITGRPIRRVVVSEEEARASAAAQGLPEEAVRMRLGLFAAARDGEFARVDPTLAQLIGRPPTSMRKVLEQMLSPVEPTSRL